VGAGLVSPPLVLSAIGLLQWWVRTSIRLAVRHFHEVS
jgi:hypothetical protein